MEVFREAVNQLASKSERYPFAFSPLPTFSRFSRKELMVPLALLEFQAGMAYGLSLVEEDPDIDHPWAFLDPSLLHASARIASVGVIELEWVDLEHRTGMITAKGLREPFLADLLASYRQRVDAGVNSCLVFYDGQKVKDTDTPESLDMELGFGYELDILEKQTGG